jgi:hypothetical protein
VLGAVSAPGARGDITRVPAMMVRPWTQRIEARWRPEISFFEHRYEILRHLEAAKLLSAFRMLPSERISVRLGDAKHELLFGPDRIVLTLRAVDADTERLDVAAGLVIDAIKPRRSLRPQIDLQYLIPLDVAYAEARTTGLRRLVGDEPVGNGALVDWALTTDGVLENPAVRFNVRSLRGSPVGSGDLMRVRGNWRTNRSGTTTRRFPPLRSSRMACGCPRSAYQRATRTRVFGVPGGRGLTRWPE